jgi:hypothetical protein
LLASNWQEAMILEVQEDEPVLVQELRVEAMELS